MKLPRRYSIAGLMVVVLVISLALTALRTGSAAWAGGLYLLTHAVIALAIVGALCRGASERPWWLGVAGFGWVYSMQVFPFGGYGANSLPTTVLLDLLKPAGVGPYQGAFYDPGSGPFSYYWLAGHSLWNLVAALVGGGLAHWLFARPPAAAEVRHPTRQPRSRPRWRRLVITGLAAMVMVTALVWIAPRSDPALWAGAIYMLTWVVVGTAALGFACIRGPRRMVWLGAALFGLGYMTLNRGSEPFESHSYEHLVADQFLLAVRPWLPPAVSGFPAENADVARANRRVWKALEQPVPMTFPRPVSLETLLKHVRTATRSPGGGEVKIYVDPVGLREAEKTMESTIEMKLEGLPLSSTLRLALKQLGMIYYVRDGLICITAVSSEDSHTDVDYYLLLGHSVLALLAAALGAWLVPLVSGRRDERAAVEEVPPGDGSSMPPGEGKS